MLYEPAEKLHTILTQNPLLHMYTLSRKPVYTIYGYIGTDVYVST
jgi:hypothetical protein